MASFPEYDQFDGIGLAELIRKGDISGREVCEEAIRRAESLNPKLNAIVTKTYDLARETEKFLRGDALFSGVPFLLKDAHHARIQACVRHRAEGLRADAEPLESRLLLRRLQRRFGRGGGRGHRTFCFSHG